MLIISAYIEKNEIKPLEKFISFTDIASGILKIQKGLGIEIKSFTKGYQYFKVRVGTRAEARMIVFLITEKDAYVPVLVRLKKDKVYGMNMSAQNKDVCEKVLKNVSYIADDLKMKRYKTYDVHP